MRIVGMLTTATAVVALRFSIVVLAPVTTTCSSCRTSFSSWKSAVEELAGTRWVARLNPIARTSRVASPSFTRRR